VIQADEAIMQDQLIPAANEPGWVNVKYPRGSATVLRVDNHQSPPVSGTSPAGSNGEFEQFRVRADGHLECRSLQSTGVAAIVLGMSLKPL
jgi:hypothetical protein